ncbi:MAG: aspartate kinase [Tidjanibacter sp.]|nr:aspartate kinase [Tidjanibacter sp.]
MKIYKFGGASVKSADGVRNLANIVADTPEELFVVVSAMGKTTNALEKILDLFYDGMSAEAEAALDELVEYHFTITSDLWGWHYMPARAARFFDELREIVRESDPSLRSYEVWYDRVVSVGELVSTAIVSAYLEYDGLPNKWVDMRELFVTSHRHRDANIDMERSAERLCSLVARSEKRLFVGQGFIGATPEGVTTTIGREGSDYSAAVAGYLLEAESVSIWKDVDGILNGDPKIFENTTLIPELSYMDAVELAHSGAQIIHPKTIKPLQNKSIPLHVKCFLDKTKPGSVIRDGVEVSPDIPIFILKRRQALLKVIPQDFSFMLEEKILNIFTHLSAYPIKINLIQSSAISLNLCIDDHDRYTDEIVATLREEGFDVSCVKGLEFLTVRGYDSETAHYYGNAEGVILMQRSAKNLRIVKKVI